MLLQTLVHYSLHLVFPALVAYILFKRKWKLAWTIMVGTMLVDLDHLLARPIFDPERCSIGFHPLHSEIAIVMYVVMLSIPNVYVRMVSVGLLLHMLADWQDCLWV